MMAIVPLPADQDLPVDSLALDGQIKTGLQGARTDSICDQVIFPVIVLHGTHRSLFVPVHFL
jgi:hypothetical protein